MLMVPDHSGLLPVLCLSTTDFVCGGVFLRSYHHRRIYECPDRREEKQEDEEVNTQYQMRPLLIHRQIQQQRTHTADSDKAKNEDAADDTVVLPFFFRVLWLVCKARPSLLVVIAQNFGRSSCG
jgi:hypothetical protein